MMIYKQTNKNVSKDNNPSKPRSIYALPKWVEWEDGEERKRLKLMCVTINNTKLRVNQA